MIIIPLPALTSLHFVHTEFQPHLQGFRQMTCDPVVPMVCPPVIAEAKLCIPSLRSPEPDSDPPPSQQPEAF